MHTKLTRTADQKKGILIFFQSALAKPNRQKPRASVEIRLDRRMHTVFARVVGEDGTVPSKGIYKVRGGEQHPWRVLSRRMKEARAAGAPKEVLLAILEEMKLWVVEDLYAGETSTGEVIY